MPRSGKPQRFLVGGFLVSGFRFLVTGSPEESPGAADSRPQPPRLSSESRLRRLLDRNRAAALALARVLARPAGVAGLAAALPLARVHALAGVLHVGRGASALALTGVLPRAAGVAALAAALALARVLARADVLVGRRLLVLGLLVPRRGLGAPAPGERRGAREAGAREHAGDRQPDRLGGQVTLLHPSLLFAPTGPSEIGEPTWLRRATRVSTCARHPRTAPMVRNPNKRPPDPVSRSLCIRTHLSHYERRTAADLARRRSWMPPVDGGYRAGGNRPAWTSW